MIRNTGRAHQPHVSGESSEPQRRFTKHEQIAMMTTLEKCTRTMCLTKSCIGTTRQLFAEGCESSTTRWFRSLQGTKSPSVRTLLIKTTRRCRFSFGALWVGTSIRCRATEAATKKTYRLRQRYRRCEVECPKRIQHLSFAFRKES